LTGGGIPGPPLIKEPQPLIIIERIVDLDSRCQVGIVVRYVKTLGCIETIERHKLDTRTDVQVQLCVLDAVGEGDAIRIGSEFVRVAE
jgi:hypothetical protein